MCLSSENSFLVKIIFQNSQDNIEFDIMSSEFTEPVIEDIEEITTFEQLIYYFDELFGENLYGYLEQQLYDLVDDLSIESIDEVHIINNTENITYFINLNKKTIDIE